MHSKRYIVSLLIEETMPRRTLYVDTLIHAEAEAVPYKIFALVGSQTLLVCWEIDNAGFKHDALI